MEQFTYDDIDSIGKELFTKNNNNFISTKLSPIMSKIFIFANKEMNITITDNDKYMKSGSIPDRIYYIYTDQVDSRKMYDIVNFKDKPCIWFYSKNAITNATDDMENIFHIYKVLLKIFRYPNTREDVYLYQSIDVEYYIIKCIMSARLFLFIHDKYSVLDEYGILDIDKFKSILKKKLDDFFLAFDFTNESFEEFFNHVKENAYNEKYFKSKIYLDSFDKLQLERK